MEVGEEDVVLRRGQFGAGLHQRICLVGGRATMGDEGQG